MERRHTCAVHGAGDINSIVAVYLFDSDVLIGHLRRKRSIEDYVEELEAGDRLCCSVISLAEIYAGMRPEEENPTRKLMESLFHFPVTREIAEKAGEIKRELKSKGHNIYLDDCLIAATAVLQDAILVTLNQKHYPTVFKKLPL